MVLKECLSHIVLSTGFLPLTPHHVFITDKFGTPHHLPVTSDADGNLTLNLSLLPAGHFMAFSGSYQLQVYTGAITEPTCTPVPDGEALELTICGNTYNCITLSFEANPAHLTTQTIPGCDALQPVTADELFCVNEYTGNFCPSVKACLGITPEGTGIRFLNDRGEFVEVEPGATTLGALTNVLPATDAATDGDYVWTVTGGQFALQPFTVDLSGYYTGAQVDALVTTLSNTVQAHLTDYDNPHQFIMPPATETEAGIAPLATQAEVQDELTTQDTRIVTPLKLWQGLQRFVQLSITWAAKQIFTTAPRFSSAAASQYLKTDSSNDLTSVATIPATDIAEDTSHRFVTDIEKAGWNNTNSIGSKLYLFHNY